MWWIGLGAFVWLVGAAVPWGREELTFRERLADPMSLLAGVFAVTALLPFVWLLLMAAGFVAAPFLGG